MKIQEVWALLLGCLLLGALPACDTADDDDTAADDDDSNDDDDSSDDDDSAGDDDDTGDAPSDEDGDNYTDDQLNLALEGLLPEGSEVLHSKRYSTDLRRQGETRPVRTWSPVRL